MRAAEYKKEVRSILRLSVPLALGELGWMAMAVVDNVMVGRLPNSAEAIGAASLGGALFYGFAIFGLGLMSGLDSFVSQAFGADDWTEVRRSLASGLVLALCATPILVALVLGSIPLLGLIGVTGAVRDQAAGFTRVLVWSLPLLLLYTTFRRYLQGIHYVKPITFALVSSNVVNAFGNWLLIYGHWGAPALGVGGSALSTVIARIYLAGMLGIAVYRRDPSAFLRMQPDPAHVGRLFRVGFPAALTIGFEVGVFNLATALAGKLDPISLAAHTIALNAAAVAYMVPLGIGSAAAVSVGRALGAGDRTGAARAGWMAIGLAALLEVVSAALFLVFPRQIASVYTRDAGVISFSIALFAVAAVFQIADGVQTVASGALRGAGITRNPMILNLVGYWAIGLPLGCWLCFRWKWGVVGLWDGLCLALILIAAGLIMEWRAAGKRFAKMPLPT